MAIDFEKKAQEMWAIASDYGKLDLPEGAKFLRQFAAEVLVDAKPDPLKQIRASQDIREWLEGRVREIEGGE